MKKSWGKYFLVLLAVLLVLSLTPAAALAEEIDDILGPLTLDSGSVANREKNTSLGSLTAEKGTLKVGESTDVVVTVITGDSGTLPKGMSIAWTSSDEALATVTPKEGAPEEAIITGIAPGAEVAITAQLLDETGAFTNEISNTVIEITGEAAADAFHPYFWILIVVIIAVVVIVVVVLVTRSKRARGRRK